MYGDGDKKEENIKKNSIQKKQSKNIKPTSCLKKIVLIKKRVCLERSDRSELR